MIKWLLAYRTGGDFKDHHVYEMIYNIRQFYSDIPIVVYTDSTTLESFDNNCYIKAFRNNHATGWWCKLELFRDERHAIYTDLDVVLLEKNVDLVELAGRVDNEEFVSLFPFCIIHNTKFGKITNPIFNSSVMFWKGDFSILYDSWEPEIKKKMHGDQNWIGDCIIQHEYRYSFLQDSVQVKSYKRDYLHGDMECDVLCFHGRPRPTLDYLKLNLPEAYELRNYHAKQ